MILSLDLGSTRFKAGVFDDQARLTASVTQPVVYRPAKDNRVEIDAAHVDALLDRIVADVLAESRVDPARLTAVAIASQAQTFTLLSSDRRARLPFISWQDLRATRTAERLSRDPRLRGFARHCSFGDFLPGLQLCLLAHLRETGAGLPRPDDAVVSLPAYAVSRLSGALFTDDNLAAMSGLYSLEGSDWWPPALEACGLSRDQLPTVAAIGTAPARTRLPTAAERLPGGIPIVLAGNDQTAGAYGADLHRNDAVLIVLGTAQVAYVCTQQLCTPATALARGVYPGGRFYRMGADNSGGNCVNWAATAIPGCSGVEQFLALAAEAPRGAHGVTFTPDGAAGAGTWAKTAARNSPADLARAVLETLAARMRATARAVCPDYSAREVLLAGGGSRATVWVRLLEETLGVPLQVVAADALTGAAKMARDAFATPRVEPRRGVMPA